MSSLRPAWLTWGLERLDVRAYMARDGISRRVKGAPGHDGRLVCLDVRAGEAFPGKKTTKHTWIGVSGCQCTETGRKAYPGPHPSPNPNTRCHPGRPSPPYDMKGPTQRSMPSRQAQPPIRYERSHPTLTAPHPCVPGSSRGRCRRRGRRRGGRDWPPTWTASLRVLYG